jgi:chlorobactene glucosyltransferase
VFPTLGRPALDALFLFGTLYVLALSISNVLWLRLSARTPDHRCRGRVSVLVPARNEERTIARCLDSLLAQTYPDLEVVVLDDESSDATREIIEDYARRHPDRMRAMRGAPLPPHGWIGKPHALRQLAAIATGELLFFTDADTVHSPSSVAWAVTNLARHRADLLSGYVHQDLESLGEALVVPATYLMSALILPLWLIPATRAPALSFAIGQLMLVRRCAFDAVGGEAAVASSISDDVAFARAIKSAGFRTVFLDAGRNVRCRMYEGYGAAVEGISKNIYDFFRTRPALFAAALTLLVALVLAPLALLLLASGPGGPSQALGGAVLAFLAAWSLTVWDRRLRWWVPLLYPLLFGHLVWMAWRCFARAVTGRGVVWKGRVVR